MLNVEGLTPAEAMHVYAEHGLSTFPCNGKVPLTLSGFKDATRCHDRISHWKDTLKITSIGIPTGSANGIFVLDVDLKSGGPETLAKLEEVHGKLPPTVSVKTGGGGMHFYFRCGDEAAKNSAGAFGPGIDVRANGGYVIVPPSLHHNGTCYAFAEPVVLNFNDLPLPPDWLSPKRPVGASPAAKPPSHWRDLVLNGVPEGQRNSSVASLAGHLLARQIDPHVALCLVEFWNKEKCHPPLTVSEVHQVFESVVKLETKKRKAR